MAPSSVSSDSHLSRTVDALSDAEVRESLRAVVLQAAASRRDAEINAASLSEVQWYERIAIANAIETATGIPLSQASARR